MVNASVLDEWLIDELPKLYRERPDIVQPLLHSVLMDHDDIRWMLVVRAYQEERINLSKAAELLGVHPVELRERFLRLGIPLRLGPLTRLKPGRKLPRCAHGIHRNTILPHDRTFGQHHLASCSKEITS